MPEVRGQETILPAPAPGQLLHQFQMWTRPESGSLRLRQSQVPTTCGPGCVTTTPVRRPGDRDSLLVSCGQVNFLGAPHTLPHLPAEGPRPPVPVLHGEDPAQFLWTEELPPGPEAHGPDWPGRRPPDRPLGPLPPVSTTQWSRHPSEACWELETLLDTIVSRVTFRILVISCLIYPTCPRNPWHLGYGWLNLLFF